MPTGSRQHYDMDLHTLVSSLELTDYTATHDDTDAPSLTLEFTVNQALLQSVLTTKADYFRAASADGTVSPDRVMDAVAADIDNALDILCNGVGVSIPEYGVYEQINDDQWQQTDPDVAYEDYHDLLWDLTGDDPDPASLSIPSLYEPFLEAAAASDDHTLPPQGTVKPILKAHFDDVRATTTASTAVAHLKSELEANGVRPRRAARIANSMEDNELLKTDVELDDADHAP